MSFIFPTELTHKCIKTEVYDKFYYYCATRMEVESLKESGKLSTEKHDIHKISSFNNTEYKRKCLFYANKIR